MSAACWSHFTLAPSVAELRPGGAEAVGHVVVHVWPALDGEDTRACGGVVAGGGFDPCESGLRTDVRVPRPLHRGKRRAGGGHLARIELRQPEIVANDRRVCTACEQRCGLLAGACVRTAEQAPCHFEPGNLDVSERIQPVGGPRLVCHPIEESQMVERTHPHDVPELQRRIDGQRTGGIRNHDGPVEGAVQRPCGACHRKGRLGE